MQNSVPKLSPSKFPGQLCRGHGTNSCMRSKFNVGEPLRMLDARPPITARDAIGVVKDDAKESRDCRALAP